MQAVTAEWGERHATALRHAWGAYRRWAATARDQKREITAWRRRVLGLTIAGAVFGAAASLAGHVGLDGGVGIPRILAGIGGVLVALAGYFTKEVLSPQREHRWVRARAVAERIKSDTFLFRTGVAPFDTAEAPAVLMDRLIEQEAGAPRAAAVEEPLDAPASRLTTDEYIRERVDDQVAFYRTREAAYERTLERGRWASVALGAVAVVLGGLGAGEWTGAVIAVITTATASVATYLYANGYKDLVVRYQTAANALEALRRRWEVTEAAAQDAARRSAFVAACEAVLLEENTGWMARWLDASAGRDGA